jgi:hypothetical protein
LNDVVVMKLDQLLSSNRNSIDFPEGRARIGTPDSHPLEPARKIKRTASKKLMSRSTGHFIGFRMITREVMK